MKILIKKLSADAVHPLHGSEGAAGWDLHSIDKHYIDAGETVLVKTGIAMAIPKGYVGLIFARSGLATKQGLAPANKVGVIDSDYRGEIMVALHNHSQNIPQTVQKGERIAQMVIVPHLMCEYEEVWQLDDTTRGVGGFGSTGMA